MGIWVILLALDDLDLDTIERHVNGGQVNERQACTVTQNSDYGRMRDDPSRMSPNRIVGDILPRILLCFVTIASDTSVKHLTRIYIDDYK